MDIDLNVPLDSEAEYEQEADDDSDHTVSLNSMIVDLESKLAPGSVVESLDSAYLLYSEYGRLVGFSVRRGGQNYFRKTSDIRMKLFVCHCEGKPDCKASINRIAKYKKQQRRTGCEARLRLSRTREGPWTVSIFHKHHNHELVDPDQSYLLRSARSLSHAKASVIETGGVQNVGFTIKDAYDHIRRTKLRTRVPNEDAKALLQYFKEKTNAEPYFYWNVMFDDEGRLMNFFIRDSRSAADYDCFGDVISLDTTFRTNRYNLICAPFVGINHHRSNVMFAIAFMSDETTTSFEWLLSTFLESMQGKEPGIIFSDQCQALMNAIDSSFHTAKHRLCQWHVNQNAPLHFGHLNGNREFKQIWYRCMNGCEDEQEFNEVWQYMMETYALQEKSWFKTMYNLRRRWASVFTNDKFSAGLHATSRSESANKVLKDLCKGTSSLHEAVCHFETLMREWRLRERAEDAYCLGTLGQFVNDNSILIQAASVYTRSVYKLFENEAVQTMNVKVIDHPNDYSSQELEFRVSSSGHVSNMRTVRYNKLHRSVSCTCHMFETDGILCRHVLKVFFTLDLPRIPEQYILQRWSKTARSKSNNHLLNPTDGVTDSSTELLLVNNIMRLTYNMAQDCKGDVALRGILNETIRGLYTRLCANHQNDETPASRMQNSHAGVDAERVVQNPRKRATRTAARKYKARRSSQGSTGGLNAGVKNGNELP